MSKHAASAVVWFGIIAFIVLPLGRFIGGNWQWLVPLVIIIIGVFLYAVVRTTPAEAHPAVPPSKKPAKPMPPRRLQSAPRTILSEAKRVSPAGDTPLLAGDAPLPKPVQMEMKTQPSFERPLVTPLSKNVSRATAGKAIQKPRPRTLLRADPRKPRPQTKLSKEAANVIFSLSMSGTRRSLQEVKPSGAKPRSLSAVRERDPYSSTAKRPPETAPQGVPTRGLVIMEEPLNKILQGRKTMELRSKHNRQLGLIALIKKGSGKIYGVAEIVESIGPMSFDEFRAHAHEHAVEPERLREIFDMGWNHGWRLRNIVSLKSPVSYIHKGMSQVKLDPGAIEALSRQLARI